MPDPFDIFSPGEELKAAATQYAGLGQIQVIVSDLVGEKIYLISTEALIPLLPSKRSPHYLPQEIVLLTGLGPEELKKVHEIKKMFEGKVVDEKEIERVKGLIEGIEEGKVDEKDVSD